MNENLRSFSTISRKYSKAYNLMHFPRQVETKERKVFSYNESVGYIDVKIHFKYPTMEELDKLIVRKLKKMEGKLGTKHHYQDKNY